MTSLEDLVARFRSGDLRLPALFDALTERGAVSDEEHARDTAWIEEQRDGGNLDAQVAKVLLAKLTSLQPAAGQDLSGVEPLDEDVTRIQVGEPSASHVNPPGVDGTTRVAPEKPPAQAEDENGTVVRPDTPAGSDEGDESDAATVVRPSSHPGHTDEPTGGDTSGTGGNTSTWQRVARETGGEYATVGMLLKGRFLLERELGRGGMGVVYLARDERKVEARDRNPYVAVKVLNDEFRRHPDSLISLQRESRRSQQLAHDNIVRVYDFDKDGTIVFMTMEYIDGTSLKAVIREEANGGMSLAKAWPFIAGMVWALQRAHRAGVVHSDFKPGNVMVAKDGTVKVFDFGIARAGKFVGESGEETVFDAGTLGALTPAYASLEMLQGGEPTPADDIYALGCVAYELLTGKHPFDKKSAEVVLKEGLRPPYVKSLNRKQNRVLASAVALHADQRIHNVRDIVDGLRKVGWRERSRPLMIYGAIVVVVLALVGFGVSRYLGARHVQEVVSRFAWSNPHHYANEDLAYKALVALGSDKNNVVAKHNSAIAGYLLQRLKVYWDPAQQRYDYAGVQHVMEIRRRLKLFSKQLNVRQEAITQQRKNMLNKLDTQLSDRIAQGRIFSNQPNNVVQTLGVIRAINPKSALLHNAELELKYNAAIGKSLDAGHLDAARRQLTLARHLFPKSKRLAQRADQLQALAKASASAPEIAMAGLKPAQARRVLGKLLDKPSRTPGWRSDVAGAMRALSSKPAATNKKLVQRLAQVIATQAATAKTPTAVQSAANQVALGLTYAPASQPLLAQQNRLGALQRQQAATLAAASLAAEVASRIESVKRAAAANDIGKVQASLARIRKLAPSNAFLKAKGAQLLASAYMGKAQTLVDAGKYSAAADTMGKGMKAVGHRADLRHAHARLEFLADLMQARTRAPTSAGIRTLRQRLGALQRSDANGLAHLQQRLVARGKLPGGSFTKAIAALQAGSVTPRSSGAQPVGRTAAAQPAPAKRVAGATQPIVGERNAGTAVTTQGSETPSAAGAAAAAGRAPAKPAPTVTSTAAPGPCARPGLAGTGRQCFDRIGNSRGPAMVVIPDKSGKAYAMSRDEITVRQYDRYCKATGHCAGASGQRSLPVTDVSLAQAKAYAAWLSHATGYTYRIPTSAQWQHAAKAGQGWKQAPDSNCIPPSGSGGIGVPVSARGRQPNPWGLVNMTGNVWEWVTNGGRGMIRGGGYDSYWSECTVASHRKDNGKPRADVGFRVLRELR